MQVFQPQSLEPYRRRLKKIMRHLGEARDTAVFREKLQAYRELSGEKSWIVVCVAMPTGWKMLHRSGYTCCVFR